MPNDDLNAEFGIVNVIKEQGKKIEEIDRRMTSMEIAFKVDMTEVKTKMLIGGVIANLITGGVVAYIVAMATK